VIICICNGVNEDAILEIVRKHGIEEVEELQKHILISNMCTGCRYTIEQILEEESKNGD